MPPAGNTGEDDSSEDSEVCKTCNKSISDNELLIFCEGQCRSWYHTTCLNITKKQLNQMEAIKNLITWLCPTCKNNLERMWDDYTTSKKILNKLNEIEGKLETKPQKILSYADALTNSTIKTEENKNICHERTLVIKPKKSQTKEATIQELKQKINPAAASAPIKYYNYTKSGCVIIKSDSAENLEKLKTHVQSKLDTKYNIEMKDQFKPQIKITGLLKEYKEGEELQQDLKLLNSKILNENDKIKITFTRQSKKSKKWTVFAETAGHTYNKLVNTRLDLGWSSCQVHENLKIIRCFRCGVFGHKSANCREDQKCTYCAGLHDRLKCDKKVKKCVNCFYVHGKFNADQPFDHDSEDERHCPILAKKCRLAREKINFNAKLE